MKRETKCAEGSWKLGPVRGDANLLGAFVDIKGFFRLERDDTPRRTSARSDDAETFGCGLAGEVVSALCRSFRR